MSWKKITVNLPEELVAFLKQVAEEDRVSVTDVLRRAINSEMFFVDQEKKHNKVLVEDADRRIHVVMRK
jgi:Arc/MetJ-type ribon-helix-helix transcriptional regulator